MTSKSLGLHSLQSSVPEYLSLPGQCWNDVDHSHMMAQQVWEAAVPVGITHFLVKMVVSSELLQCLTPKQDKERASQMPLCHLNHKKYSSERARRRPCSYTNKTLPLVFPNPHQVPPCALRSGKVTRYLPTGTEWHGPPGKDHMVPPQSFKAGTLRNRAY